MKSFLSFICLIGLAVSASGNLTGKWEGTGTKITDEGETFCQYLVFELKQTPYQLVMGPSHSKCGDKETFGQEHRLDVLNGILYYQEQEIGKVGDDFFLVDVSYGQMSVYYHGKLDADGKTMSYEQKMKNGPKFAELTTTFQRVGE